MKNTWKLPGAFLIISLLSACSPKLAGTWSIQKYETSTPGQEGVSLKNIGTITFAKSGNGEKNISYSIFGSVVEDNLPFTWTASGNLITINSEGSELSKTWIVVENKKKAQRWKSTDGANQVQILEIAR
ncbi:hypothetical protein SDC9_15595 [bioreactor metagenome]|jgi:hypothetical protein|uniref:Lipocalin-like domain-containing protein n=1 Tax=bioreactor metagenome TaxID=1076179 RepID=A0A644TS72_9ZZZZ|nr:lipocalin family protein [Lentimicrobium sp.]MEA5111233.1 lipocalin family protein [Lentimicrobium sp.]